MKALHSRCFAVIAACVLMLAALAPASAADLPKPGALSSPEAMGLMQTLGDKLTVIDVRTQEEFAQGHIPNAMLLPIQSLHENLSEVPADRPVLIVCRTGRRAEAAYNMIHEAMPNKHDIWFLRGVPSYGSDGSFTFK